MESPSPATATSTANGAHRLECLEEPIGAKGTAAATAAATATRGQPYSQDFIEPPSFKYESNLWRRYNAVRESTTGKKCKLSFKKKQIMQRMKFSIQMRYDEP